MDATFTDVDVAALLRIAGEAGELVHELHPRRAHDLTRFGRLFRREAMYVLRDPPQLLVGDELILNSVLERWHRRAIEARAQTRIDVRDATTATKLPVLGEIRWPNRIAVVVLERRR